MAPIYWASFAFVLRDELSDYIAVADVDLEIRPFAESDWGEVWGILEPVFRAGRTYPQPRDISEPQARVVWLEAARETFVAMLGGRLVGTYYIKDNAPGQGSHVCNCGYMVAESARRAGVGEALCVHSIQRGGELGYRAMQFNLVVSTNVGSVALWKKRGFQTVGILPGAFYDPEVGHVDALVMYLQLS